MSKKGEWERRKGIEKEAERTSEQARRTHKDGKPRNRGAEREGRLEERGDSLIARGPILRASDRTSSGAACVQLPKLEPLFGPILASHSRNSDIISINGIYSFNQWFRQIQFRFYGCLTHRYLTDRSSASISCHRTECNDREFLKRPRTVSSSGGRKVNSSAFAISFLAFRPSSIGIKLVKQVTRTTDWY